MSLKGTHKILEEYAGLPTATAPRDKKLPKGTARNAMLAVSLVLGVVVAVVVSDRIGEFEPAILGVIIIVCVPAVYHKFVIGKCSSAKSYFQVAAMYATMWGAPAIMVLDTMAGVPRFVVIAYAVVLALLWVLGAFLPRWI